MILSMMSLILFTRWYFDLLFCLGGGEVFIELPPTLLLMGEC